MASSGLIDHQSWLLELAAVMHGEKEGCDE